MDRKQDLKNTINNIKNTRSQIKELNTEIGAIEGKEKTLQATIKGLSELIFSLKSDQEAALSDFQNADSSINDSIKIENDINQVLIKKSFNEKVLKSILARKKELIAEREKAERLIPIYQRQFWGLTDEFKPSEAVLNELGLWLAAEKRCFDYTVAFDSANLIQRALNDIDSSQIKINLDKFFENQVN